MTTGPRGAVLRQSLVEDLERLGVKPGDTLMVHASLRAIGPIDGGGDTLIAALAQVVGESGTLLMTIGARDDHAWVNERPEHERAALLTDAIPFDDEATPADPDVGVLAELFRCAVGTRVSNHPEGRFAARGKRADSLLLDAPWHDYYGRGSPLEHLIELKGKVLRLGADRDSVTLLHYAEALADIPDKRRVRRHRCVLDAGHRRVVLIETLDDSDGIVEWEDGDYFETVLDSYLASGFNEGTVLNGTVGQAGAELLDAGDLVRHAVQWMETNLTPKSVA